MGRKRNQGKARKAAKAKAREAAEEETGDNNNQTTNGRQQSLAAQMERLQSGNMSRHDTTITCKHGFEQTDIRVRATCSEFVTAFREAFYDAGANVSTCLLGAAKATKDEFADVWNDSTKMEIVISFFLSIGTQYVLENDKHARDSAIFARFLEQYAAIRFKQTQAVFNWSKIIVLTQIVDEHTVVKFYRRRIPCTCLDKKYVEVKSITKMGICYNLQCNFPDRMVERSRTMYCSRCRCVTYCSRECQKAHWPMHKIQCDKFVDIIEEFEAKKNSHNAQ
eukprot:scaffold2899_cov85-Skeletonema_dohrnii-CCMP3373.AAC.1